jgi:hypothetical protein
VRSLKRPAALTVQVADGGDVLTVRRPGWPRARAVVRVQDRWRVVDEWWRERPIRRLYHDLLLEDGLRLTL